MNINEIIGLSVAAIIATVGIIKIELIKGIVAGITSDKGKINMFSIIVLVIVTVIPVITGYALPSVGTDDEGAKVEQTDSSNKKSDLEVGVEAAKYGIEKTEELAAKRKEKKRKEDSIFKAERSQRWVYKLSDLMEDKDALEQFYNEHKEIEGLSLFKDKKRYFFFQNIERNFDEANENLNGFKETMSNTTSVTVFDLLSKCDNPKEKLVQIESVRIGRRRDKVKIPCFEISR